MKRHLPILRGAALFFAALCAPATGAKGDPPVPVVRIDVLMVAMPEEKFIALRPDLLDQSKIEKAVPGLLEAVKRKEMILEGLPVIVTKSGQRAVSETTREFQEDDIVTPPISVPMACYTRSLGVSLEVEPVVLQDGKTIDLNLAPQQVEALTAAGGADDGKKEGAAAKGNGAPDLLKFFTMKVTTSIRLASGQHLLIAAHKMRQPEGYVEIFIVHAEVIPPGE